MTFTEAQRRDAAAKAELRELELRQRRGDLVERRQAEAVAFQGARELRDAVLAWPGRHAAVMAADLGVEPGRMLRALEAGMKQMLRDMPRPRLDMAKPDERRAEA
jgi:hypothetical protein